MVLLAGGIYLKLYLSNFTETAVGRYLNLNPKFYHFKQHGRRQYVQGLNKFTQPAEFTLKTNTFL